MASNQDCAVKAMLPLPSQLQRTSALLNNLHGSLDNLGDRLVPVRSMPPAAPGSGALRPEPSAPMPTNLSSQLSVMNERLEQAISRIESLKEQLDL